MIQIDVESTQEEEESTKIQSHCAATPATLSSVLIPSDECCPSIQFHVHISLFAKGKVLDGEGSCSLKALVFHMVAYSHLKKEKHYSGETAICLFSTLEAEMKLSVNVFQSSEISFAY